MVHGVPNISNTNFNQVLNLISKYYKKIVMK